MPYGVLRVTSHTCRVESLLDGNLYLILRPAVLNILDPPASRAADINGPRKSFQSEARHRRAAAPIKRCISSSRRWKILSALHYRETSMRFNGFGLIMFYPREERYVHLLGLGEMVYCRSPAYYLIDLVLFYLTSFGIAMNKLVIRKSMSHRNHRRSD